MDVNTTAVPDLGVTGVGHDIAGDFVVGNGWRTGAEDEDPAADQKIGIAACGITEEPFTSSDGEPFQPVGVGRADTVDGTDDHRRAMRGAGIDDAVPGVALLAGAVDGGHSRTVGGDDADVPEQDDRLVVKTGPDQDDAAQILDVTDRVHDAAERIAGGAAAGAGDVVVYVNGLLGDSRSAPRENSSKQQCNNRSHDAVGPLPKLVVFGAGGQASESSHRQPDSYTPVRGERQSEKVNI